jgi:hypothetical protein
MRYYGKVSRWGGGFNHQRQQIAHQRKAMAESKEEERTKEQDKDITMK